LRKEVLGRRAISLTNWASVGEKKEWSVNYIRIKGKGLAEGGVF